MSEPREEYPTGQIENMEVHVDEIAQLKAQLREAKQQLKIMAGSQCPKCGRILPADLRCGWCEAQVRIGELEQENTEQADMIVDYGNTVAELRRQLAELEQWKEAAIDKLSDAVDAYHGLEQELAAANRKYDTEMETIFESMKGFPELDGKNFFDGRLVSRAIRRLVEQLATTEAKLAEAEASVAAMHKALADQSIAWFASTGGGIAVHKAWRDNMLRQQRAVAPARMKWLTLSQEDRDLDVAIAVDTLKGFATWVRGHQLNGAAFLARLQESEAGAALMRQMIQSMIAAKGRKYADSELAAYAKHRCTTSEPCPACLQLNKMKVHNSVIENMEATIANPAGAAFLAKYKALRGLLTRSGRYARHTPDCAAWTGSECKCGFAEWADSTATALKEADNGD